MFDLFESKKNTNQKKEQFNTFLFGSEKKKKQEKKIYNSSLFKIYTTLAKHLATRLSSGQLQYVEAKSLKAMNNVKIQNGLQVSRMFRPEDGGPTKEELRETAIRVAKQLGSKESIPASNRQPEYKEEISESIDLSKEEENFSPPGISLFIPKKIEAKMREIGITEEELNKLSPEKLWEIFNQKILEKELKESKEEKIYTPIYIGEEYSVLANMWEEAYEKMDNVNDSKRTLEILDLTGNAGGDIQPLVAYLAKNENLKPEEKFFIEISIHLKNYKTKGKEMLGIKEAVVEEEKFGEKIEGLRNYTYDKNLTELILVLKGHKLATEFMLGDVYPEIKEEDWDRAETETDSILTMLGLKFSKKNASKTYTDERGNTESKRLAEYVIAKDEIYIKMFNVLPEVAEGEIGHREKVDDDLGKLYGFPNTAIEAFIEGEEALVSVDFKELPDDIKREDYMAFAGFRLSKKHWREELETVKKWAEDIKQADPSLYIREVDSFNMHIKNER